jgi:uncharacterized protein YutE (UPF0331/DUF86 family)
LDSATLTEKTAALERHLRRVAEKLPEKPGDLEPGSDTSDAVVLHLWQAVQIAIDAAMSACVYLGFGTPQTYRDAFVRLADQGAIPVELRDRLVRACGFRNRVVHLYEELDMHIVHAAALSAQSDLPALMSDLAGVVSARKATRQSGKRS